MKRALVVTALAAMCGGCFPFDFDGALATCLDGGCVNDAGVNDAGSVDAGSSDAGSGDAGSVDAGSSDAGVNDAGASDAGMSDAGSTDAGTDAGSRDGGVIGSPDWCPANAQLCDGFETGVSPQWRKQLSGAATGLVTPNDAGMDLVISLADAGASYQLGYAVNFMGPPLYVRLRATVTGTGEVALISFKDTSSAQLSLVVSQSQQVLRYGPTTLASSITTAPPGACYELKLECVSVCTISQLSPVMQTTTFQPPSGGFDEVIVGAQLRNGTSATVTLDEVVISGSPVPCF